MNTITKRLEDLKTRINGIARAAGRDPSCIRLLAVSKTRPSAEIREAATAGQTEFGENYLQEAVMKITALTDLSLIWHYIGALQANKTRTISAHFDWVHTVDRLKAAQRLNDQRPVSLPPLNICLQVKLSDEPAKRGCKPDELATLAESVAGLSRLRLRGLMALPAPSTSLAAQRIPFKQLHELMQMLNESGHGLDTLSMGTSGDMQAAILEGSTLLRIGTALFGPRR